MIRISILIVGVLYCLPLLVMGAISLLAQESQLVVLGLLVCSSATIVGGALMKSRPRAGTLTVIIASTVSVAAIMLFKSTLNPANNFARSGWAIVALPALTWMLGVMALGV
jgi:hypothetical protein